MAYRYVFGPVYSGRLGLSLGLDLLGCKACSMDCVYCEVGATTELTLTRRVYAPARDILRELEDWASRGLETQYVTLGGSGEPCLNTDMGAVIEGVRRILPGKQVAVLTNSTLLPDPEVRRQLLGADAVLPSLDTLVENEFRRINRACPGLSPLDIAEAMLTFRAEYNGRILLEILLAAGYNDSEENLALLKDFVSRLRPDRVDVTTLSRPGTLEAARAVDSETMARWREALGAEAASGQEHHKADEHDLPLEDVVEMIRASLARRPQTVLHLVAALGVSEHDVTQALKTLEGTGLRTTTDGHETYYSLLRD